jgi:hypothetical protein
MQRKEEIQRYLKANVSHVIEELMTEIVVQQPKNVITFCKNWFTYL